MQQFFSRVKQKILLLLKNKKNKKFTKVDKIMNNPSKFANKVKII